MSSLRALTYASALILTLCFAVPLAAQDMDTLEGVHRQQYERLTAQENSVQQQMDVLMGLKSGVDDLIGQVSTIPSEDYSQEADRYRQLELLLPSATRYSEELARRQKQLQQLQQQKATLRSQILERRSDLPVWWRE
jgi:hypothetical protein